MEKKKYMECLSGQSRTCKVTFITTSAERICPSCKSIQEHVSTATEEKDEEDQLTQFWKNLK